MKKLKTKYFLVFIELYPSGSKNQFAFNPEAFSFFKPAARKEHLITYKNNDYCTSFFLIKIRGCELIHKFHKYCCFSQTSLHIHDGRPFRKNCFY